MKRTALFIAIVLLFTAGCRNREAMLFDGSLAEGGKEDAAASDKANASNSGIFQVTQPHQMPQWYQMLKTMQIL